jgi:1,4-dihydroxy-2-naphthoate octaprenyltransferase
MPVFWFAFSVSENIIVWKAMLVFFILHGLLFPASNGFNSYFDQDEGSIGGLENPPPSTKNLYNWSLILDLAAISLGLFINWQFSIMLLAYGLASKAYSHPAIRLKKMPIIGWLSVGLFQGYFVFLMSIYSIAELSFYELFSSSFQIPALLSSALLMGSYPMTQVYQHEEDIKRGDITLSVKLGILGTFYFTGIFFFLSNLGFVLYYTTQVSLWAAVTFELALTPVVLFFLYWFIHVRKNVTHANYKNTMRLNIISSLLLSLFFIAFNFLF